MPFFHLQEADELRGTLDVDSPFRPRYDAHAAAYVVSAPNAKQARAVVAEADLAAGEDSVSARAAARHLPNPWLTPAMTSCARLKEAAQPKVLIVISEGE